MTNRRSLAPLASLLLSGSVAALTACAPPEPEEGRRASTARLAPAEGEEVPAPCPLGNCSLCEDLPDARECLQKPPPPPIEEDSFDCWSFGACEPACDPLPDGTACERPDPTWGRSCTSSSECGAFEQCSTERGECLSSPTPPGVSAPTVCRGTCEARPGEPTRSSSFLAARARWLAYVTR